MSDRLICVTSISPRLIARIQPTGLDFPDHTTGATRYQVWLAKSDTFTYPTAAEAQEIADAWAALAEYLGHLKSGRVLVDHERSEVELTDEEADRIVEGIDELTEAGEG